MDEDIYNDAAGNLGEENEQESSAQFATDLMEPEEKSDLLSQVSDAGWAFRSIALDESKKELSRNTKSFTDFFGEQFRDFKRIVTNGATCNDTRKNRNPNLAANFLSFDNEFQQRMYYAELGGAHTMLSRQATAASIINASKQFKDKVCVVNLYCDNCTTPEEGLASNWSFGSIEKDIAQYFLPLCKSDFTLFDLTGDDPVIKRFQVYGQFLIVARNQN